MLELVKEGGWPALVALGLGLLGLLAAGLAVVMLITARRAAFAVGLGAIALAVVTALVGVAGVLLGRHQVDRALVMVSDSALADLLRRVGYGEAQACGKIGFAASLVPLIVGAVAAFVGARARYAPAAPVRPGLALYRDAPPVTPNSSPLRLVVAASASLVALVASGAALALGVARPPPGRYPFDTDDRAAWDLASATERARDARLVSCESLEQALDALRKPDGDRRAMPRTFARDPAALVPDAPAAATACARSIFEEVRAAASDGRREPADALLASSRSWDRDALLESSLLLDEALAREIAAWEPTRARHDDAGAGEDAAPAANGALDPDVIRRVVNARAPAVQACYERGLGQNPGLTGRVDVAFTIDERGKVSAAKVATSTLDDEAVEACVVGVVERLDFPRPKGGTVNVQYPYVFTLKPAR